MTREKALAALASLSALDYDGELTFEGADHRITVCQPESPGVFGLVDLRDVLGVAEQLGVELRLSGFLKLG